MKEKESFTYIDYSQFWDLALQKLEEIQVKLDRDLLGLEKKYEEFEGIYSLIEEEVNTLSSIYSSLNTVGGNNYLLKLKSVIKKYKKRYTREGINFNLINYLIMKITEYRNRSFDDFPALVHSGPVTGHKKKKAMPGGMVLEPHRPFKWITFNRNGSWFIAGFTDIEFTKGDEGEIISQESRDTFQVKIKDKTILVRDIFSTYSKIRGNPGFFIILDRGNRAYAADKIGDRIYARKDFISPEIKPFPGSGVNPLSPGRFRILGRNHIVLNREIQP